jgi:hypothetical protein
MLAELRLGLLAFPPGVDLHARPAGRCSSRNFQQKLGPKYLVLPDAAPGKDLAAYLRPAELAARREQTKARIVCNESAGAYSFETTKEEKALCVISEESGAAEILRNDKARLFCQIPCQEDNLRSKVHEGYKLEGEFPGRAGADFSIHVSCVYETLEGSPQDVQCNDGRWDNLTVRCGKKPVTTTTPPPAASDAAAEAQGSVAHSQNATASQVAEKDIDSESASESSAKTLPTHDNQTASTALGAKIAGATASASAARNVTSNTSITATAAEDTTTSDEVVNKLEEVEAKALEAANTSETAPDAAPTRKNQSISGANVAQEAPADGAKEPATETIVGAAAGSATENSQSTATHNVVEDQGVPKKSESAKAVADADTVATKQFGSASKTDESADDETASASDVPRDEDVAEAGAAAAEKAAAEMRAAAAANPGNKELAAQAAKLEAEAAKFRGVASNKHEEAGSADAEVESGDLGTASTADSDIATAREEEKKKATGVAVGDAPEAKHIRAKHAAQSAAAEASAAAPAAAAAKTAHAAMEAAAGAAAEARAAADANPDDPELAAKAADLETEAAEALAAAEAASSEAFRAGQGAKTEASRLEPTLRDSENVKKTEQAADTARAGAASTHAAAKQASANANAAEKAAAEARSAAAANPRDPELAATARRLEAEAAKMLKKAEVANAKAASLSGSAADLAHTHQAERADAVKSKLSDKSHAPPLSKDESDHIKVRGAGSSEWNGVYRPIEGETNDGATVYAKDDKHRLERSDGAWRFARPGRYVAYRERANADADAAFTKAQAAVETAENSHAVAEGEANAARKIAEDSREAAAGNPEDAELAEEAAELEEAATKAQALEEAARLEVVEAEAAASTAGDERDAAVASTPPSDGWGVAKDDRAPAGAAVSPAPVLGVAEGEGTAERPRVPKQESDSESTENVGDVEDTPSHIIGARDHVDVTGAGSQEWNGVYRPIESETSDGATVYEKDDKHRIERSDGAWHLARPGRYVAYRERVSADAETAVAQAQAAAEAATNQKEKAAAKAAETANAAEEGRAAVAASPDDAAIAKQAAELDAAAAEAQAAAAAAERDVDVARRATETARERWKASSATPPSHGWGLAEDHRTPVGAAIEPAPVLRKVDGKPTGGQEERSSTNEVDGEAAQAEDAAAPLIVRGKPIKVSGAGSAQWNGIYRPLRRKSRDGAVVYAKDGDDSHRLELSDGAWRLQGSGYTAYRRYMLERDRAKAAAEAALEVAREAEAEAKAKARAAARAAEEGSVASTESPADAELAERAAELEASAAEAEATLEHAKADVEAAQVDLGAAIDMAGAASEESKASSSMPPFDGWDLANDDNAPAGAAVGPAPVLSVTEDEGTTGAPDLAADLSEGHNGGAAGDELGMELEAQAARAEDAGNISTAAAPNGEDKRSYANKLRGRAQSQPSADRTELKGSLEGKKKKDAAVDLGGDLEAKVAKALGTDFASKLGDVVNEKMERKLAKAEAAVESEFKKKQEDVISEAVSDAIAAEEAAEDKEKDMRKDAVSDAVAAAMEKADEQLQDELADMKKKLHSAAEDSEDELKDRLHAADATAEEEVNVLEQKRLQDQAVIARLEGYVSKLQDEQATASATQDRLEESLDAAQEQAAKAKAEQEEIAASSADAWRSVKHMQKVAKNISASMDEQNDALAKAEERRLEAKRDAKEAAKRLAQEQKAMDLEVQRTKAAAKCGCTVEDYCILGFSIVNLTPTASPTTPLPQLPTTSPPAMFPASTTPLPSYVATSPPPPPLLPTPIPGVLWQKLRRGLARLERALPPALLEDPAGPVSCAFDPLSDFADNVVPDCKLAPVVFGVALDVEEWARKCAVIGTLAEPLLPQTLPTTPMPINPSVAGEEAAVPGEKVSRPARPQAEGSFQPATVTLGDDFDLTIWSEGVTVASRVKLVHFGHSCESAPATDIRADATPTRAAVGSASWLGNSGSNGAAGQYTVCVALADGAQFLPLRGRLTVIRPYGVGKPCTVFGYRVDGFRQLPSFDFQGATIVRCQFDPTMPGADKVSEPCRLHESVASFPDGVDVVHWGSDASCAKRGYSIVSRVNF